jgi:polyisoprenoid-binding protein YceI
MKKLILILLLVPFHFLISSGNAQTLFSTSTGEISFYSYTPVEDINAVNKKIGSIINSDTREVAVQMRMTDFSFPNKLMQEHFNENYLESEKYPTATFRGKITGNEDFTSPGNHAVKATGTMKIHGVEKPMDLVGQINSDGKVLKLKLEFLIKLADYKIEIPTLVFAKIAEEIQVKGVLDLVKK